MSRILVGALCGGAIGYERALHGHPAGLRTHIIVAMAASMFMVVSTHFVYFQTYGPQDLVEVDSSRIAASVVSGIGFLAGGAIFRRGLTVRGLTTAAGLWLVAALGLAAGAGMYIEAGSGTGLGLVALSILRRFEDKHDDLTRRKLSLTLTQPCASIAKIADDLRAMGASVAQTQLEKEVDAQLVRVLFDLQLPGSLTSDKLINSLESYQGVQYIRVEPFNEG